MSTPRLAARVPSARAVCAASLPGHRLVFHKLSLDGSGKCDALFSGDPQDRVNGVLYRIDAEHREALDAAEGVGWGYAHASVSVSPAQGQPLWALTYIARAIDAHLRPYSWYLHHVIAGALEHGFPDPYLDRLRSVETLEDPDPERAARELSIYGQLQPAGVTVTDSISARNQAENP